MVFLFVFVIFIVNNIRNSFSALQELPYRLLQESKTGICYDVYYNSKHIL